MTLQRYPAVPKELFFRHLRTIKAEYQEWTANERATPRSDIKLPSLNYSDLNWNTLYLTPEHTIDNTFMALFPAIKIPKTLEDKHR
jgi:hypothetical protein